MSRPLELGAFDEQMITELDEARAGCAAPLPKDSPHEPVPRR